MDVMQAIEREHVAELTADKEIPDFGPGDTIRVGVRVVEGEKVRVQAFEGVCIARKGRGLNANFTVRKISFGEGVERVFPLYAPVVDSITVVRRGRVRRAKLYYLRGRTGRAARIRELTTGRPSKTAPVKEAPAPVEAPVPEVTEAAPPVPVAEPDAPEAPEAPEARGPETETPAVAIADEEVAVVPEGDGEEISAPQEPEETEEDGAAGSPSGIKKLFGRFGRGKK